MSNPDIQHFQLADLRRFADKAPFDIQQTFHALLNAYEASEEHGAAAENYEDQLERARGALATLEGLLPKAEPVPPTKRGARPPPSPPERLSDDAWAEYLQETPEAERQAAITAELQRARAGEAAALARVEALEEGIESAVEDLGQIDEAPPRKLPPQPRRTRSGAVSCSTAGAAPTSSPRLHPLSERSAAARRCSDADRPFLLQLLWRGLEGCWRAARARCTCPRRRSRSGRPGAR